MVRKRISGDVPYSSPLSWSLAPSAVHFSLSPNSETAHKDALAAAQVEHQRVRDAAVQAYRNNELREARSHLKQVELQEIERLRLEKERAELAAKVIELQRKKIPIPQPPPREPTPPPAPLLQTPAKPKESKPIPIPPTVQANIPQQNIQSQRQSDQQTPPTVAQSLPQQTLAQSAPKTPSTPRAPDVLQQVALESTPAPPPNNSAIQPHILPGTERYSEIHKKLKEIRKFVVEHAKQDPAMKKKTGEMRREIRKCVGQLTEGKGVNRAPTQAITAILTEALVTLQSPPVDPTLFMVSTPQPTEGAKNNGDTIPALFIYLLNCFSKAVVSQFINEAGVSTKAADPIGVVAVQIFAKPEFCWRGASLIDILIAKIRIVCPVLFGIRGSESTEEGRARIGWWKDSGQWVNEQVHNNRMTGLGAGYAALSLRDFSRSTLKNPYPPTNYWRTVSSIVNTPPQEASSTQYTVLKALIENYEQRFMSMYGSAARAALQVALVDFPARAREKSAAVIAVTVLAEKLKRDTGLNLNKPTVQKGGGMGFAFR